MLTLSYNRTDKFVNEQKALGNDLRWDGWDLVFFKPDDKGIYSSQGAFRDGVWGFDNRVTVNEKGLWDIDWRNIKRRKRVSGSRS